MRAEEKNKSGFVLLYAVLVASIVAIGGTLLADIIFKQLILSSVGRESQFAYYAAEAGEECARYWSGPNQSGGYAFGIVWPVSGDDCASGQCEYYPPVGVNTISCNDNSGIVVDDIRIQDGADGVGEFSFIMPDLPNNSCAVVNVIQDANQENSLLIESKGYNIGDSQCDPTGSPRRIERRVISS